MAQCLSNQVLPRWLLLQAGGSLQHARSLLSLTATLGSLSSSGSSSSSSSSNGSVLSQEAGRSISTTRGIYMGRSFLKENLQRHPAHSSLFNRDNYQHLVQNGWSLAAAEQVLHNHQQARGPRMVPAVFQQLTANLAAVENLEQLQLLINRHAHQMNVILLCKAIAKAPQVMLRPDGTPDYQAAALVLESIGRHLQSKAADLNAGGICYIMASYVKCRCSPPADLMHGLLQSLLLNDSEKLLQTNPHQLSQLLLALTKMVQPQGQWPLMKAVLKQATNLLQQQLDQPQQHQQQLEGDGSSSSGSDLQQQQQQQAQRRRQRRGQPEPDPQKNLTYTVNATALTALLLDRSNSYSPEYYRLLYQWLEGKDRLSVLYPNSAVQLWCALKGHWAKFEARTSANSPSAAAAAAADAAGTDADVVGADADVAEADSALTSASDSTRVGLQENQQKLYGFFGKETLESLVAVTIPLVSSMTETNLGQLFNSLGRMRYLAPDLLAAASEAYQALCRVQTPTNITKANAAWAGAQLQWFDPALFLPAILLAATTPEECEGFLAARIMIATSQMTAEALQQMQLLLRQELHRQSGARGPVPPAVGQADPATSAAGQVPEWIASLADNLAGRIPELRPREIAYILLSYSQLPGVPVHEGLFSAAAEHIVAHAETFVVMDDMEMVATAFDRFNFKAGVPALKALQEQSEKLAAPAQASAA